MSSVLSKRRGATPASTLRENDIVVTKIGGPGDPTIRRLRALRPPAGDATRSGGDRPHTERPPTIARSGRRSLERCFSPVPLSHVKQCWGNQPLHVARGGRDRARFGEILSLDILDDLLANRRVPRETIFVLDAHRVEGGEFQPLPAESPIGSELASQGASLYFHFIDQFCPSLRAFCDELEHCLARPVSAFAFLTPPRAQARKLHWDPLDVIILQVEGQKTWDLHEPLIDLPLAEHDSNDYAFDTKRTMRVTLRPGDTLYIPRGWIHKAVSTDDISFSITIGVRPLTWLHVVSEPRRRTLQRARVEQTLDTSITTATPIDELVRSHLALVRDQARLALVRERAVSEVRHMATSAVAIAPGYVSSFFLGGGALCALTFQRSSAPFLLEPRGRRWALASRGRRTTLSAAEMDWLRGLLTRRGPFQLPAPSGAVIDVRSLAQRLTALGIIELAGERGPEAKRR